MNKKTQIYLSVMIAGALSSASMSMAGQKNQSSAKKSTGDQFQLTLSPIPYSSDPTSAFVRQHCKPRQKHGRKNKKPGS